MSTIAVDNVKPSAGGTSVDLMAGLVKSLATVDQEGTQALIGSDVFNIASITDDSAGGTQVALTNNMGAANYGILIGIGPGAGVSQSFYGGLENGVAVATTGYEVLYRNTSNLDDAAYFCGATVGALA